MKKLTRTLVATSLGALTIAVAATVPATAAHAAKGTCRAGLYPTDSSYKTYCEGSYPSVFYAKVNCYPYGGGTMITRIGPDRVAGNNETLSTSWSFATCPSGYEAAGGKAVWR